MNLEEFKAWVDKERYYAEIETSMEALNVWRKVEENVKTIPSDFNLREWQRCPVCEGHGLVPYPPGVAVSMPFTSSSMGPWVCPTCKGIGKIEKPL